MLGTNRYPYTYIKVGMYSITWTLLPCHILSTRFHEFLEQNKNVLVLVMSPNISL